MTKPLARVKPSAARKPRAATMRSGPTARDIDRLGRAPAVAERRREQIGHHVRKVAEIAVQFAPVSDDLAPLDTDAIERRVWEALTELTGIRPEKAAGRTE